ncbi:unnamed protein product [Didymodactylos carnosus]|uniref:type I protein arginine methyltransferase n=1 Tax=Didymodactylos carnosus TaxID=1234261 RepID=A0A813XL79_9BILA|nr:unnamed protein product [Didymodactylos carnosus]CAF0869766.1 unnamed protein product [Didymodactylos carnosus]CAF3507904.1 unnamed protein product [Didymodactylos carnosus]CAF3657142.1 unnamed protein product [Didymodactylos carnosus]
MNNTKTHVYEYHGVEVFSLNENGAISTKSKTPASSILTIKKENNNTRLINVKEGHTPVLTLSFDGSVECARVGTKGIILSVPKQLSYLIKFSNEDDLSGFSKHIGLSKRDTEDEGCLFDERTEESSAMQYFQFYGYLSQQQNMMQDYIRTSTYQRAILDNSIDFADKVVLDVGAGSGILSFFAAQSGAKKVYAVEASSMAQHAKLLVDNNHLSNCISVIPGKIEEIQLPEQVDIIISEPMGYMLFNERMLETYLHAKKWLKPNGKMFPTLGDLHVTPFTDEALYMEQVAKANFWYQQSFYGVDLTTLREAALDEYFKQPIVDNFDVRICLSRPIKHTVNFLTASEEDLYKIKIPLTFQMTTTAVVHGLAFWFDVAFDGTSSQVWLSTAPTQPLTHWYQVRCLFMKPLTVNQGQVIKGHATLHSNRKQSYDVEIFLQVEGTTQSAENTLDLKNPYFRYPNQPLQVPPGQYHESPTEQYWNALPVDQAMNSSNMHPNANPYSQNCNINNNLNMSGQDIEYDAMSNISSQSSGYHHQQQRYIYDANGIPVTSVPPYCHSNNTNNNNNSNNIVISIEMLQSENMTWNIDRKIDNHDIVRPQLNKVYNSLPNPLSSQSPINNYLYDSKPIGKPLCLRLNHDISLSPQLILEDKVFRSAIRLQHGTTSRSQILFVGTLIVDDETNRLTFVIDRLQLDDTSSKLTSNLLYKQLPGEFFIPVRFDTTLNHDVICSIMNDGINVIDTYCQSTSKLELHNFFLLYGHMTSRLTPSINANLTFDLLTIKNEFKLNPINSVTILPTALLKNITTGLYMNQQHFGYCGIDRTSKNKLLLILENDPQACALPLVGIWVSGVINVQSPFVWAVCIRYCMNLSLKHRIRSLEHQPFILLFYSSLARGKCEYYEVTTTNQHIDYHLWTTTKKIIMPTTSTNDNATNLPYDFDFKHVYDGPKMHALLDACGINSKQSECQQPYLVKSHSTPTPIKTPQQQFSSNASILSDDEDDNPNNEEQEHLSIMTYSPNNTNGSLYGVPRQPPKQTNSPVWSDVTLKSSTQKHWPVKTLKNSSPPTTPILPTSPVQQPDTRITVELDSLLSTVPPTIPDSPLVAQFKEEILEKMNTYDAHIQSLNTLVSQLLAQKSLIIPSLPTTPNSQDKKVDVGVQSDSLSPIPNEDGTNSYSNTLNNDIPIKRQTADFNNTTPRMLNNVQRSSSYEQRQQQQAQVQSVSKCINNSPSLSKHNQPPVVDYSLLYKSTDFSHYHQQSNNLITPLRRSFDSINQFSSHTSNSDQQLKQLSSVSTNTNNNNINEEYHQHENNNDDEQSEILTEINPENILKPFFQYMAQQRQIVEFNNNNSSTSKLLDTTLKTIEKESTKQAEKISQLANVIQNNNNTAALVISSPTIRRRLNSGSNINVTSTTGISFTVDHQARLQMQIINQQSTTLYQQQQQQQQQQQPVQLQTPPKENDLSFEVRSIAMKYLEDDQLVQYSNQCQIQPQQQSYDKGLSFATQKYLEKYGLLNQHQYLSELSDSSSLNKTPLTVDSISDDDDDYIENISNYRNTSSVNNVQKFSKIIQRIPSTSSDRNKILDLTQIRKLPKLL